MTYNIGTVSPVALAGMVFSLIISVGLPIALCVIAKKKLGAALSSVLTGAAVFAVFVLGLESVTHRFVLQSAAGATITGNVGCTRFTAVSRRRFLRSLGGLSR